jgi:cation diffusion facilitator family transporter
MASPDVAASHRVARRVALIGIVVSGLLATLNIVVGLLTHSTSVVATGVEFAGDVVASSVVFFGMVVATRPADADHPYGHGRVETIAAFLVGLILAAGGVGICWKSLQAVSAVHPPPSAAAILVLVLAIAVRGTMSAVKFRIGHRIHSASLVADAWNDTVDILAATVALVAVGLAMWDSARFLAADHYGGFTVGIIVVLTAIRVLRDSALELMDTMPDGRRIAEVREAALSVPGVRAVEKCLARKTGFTHHVDLHIEVDPAMSVADAHAIAGHVRSHLRTAVPWVADVIVHVEPAAPSVSR